VKLVRIGPVGCAIFQRATELREAARRGFGDRPDLWVHEAVAEIGTPGDA
jgi:hypothetical protein